MGDRHLISKVAAALAVLFVLAGYAVPWVHMVAPFRHVSTYPSENECRIHVFVWGVSAYVPAVVDTPAERLAISWVSLPFSVLSPRLFVEEFVSEGQHFLVGSSVCYLLATILSLFALKAGKKMARLAVSGLILASFLFFILGVIAAEASWKARQRGWVMNARTSWDVGPYLCLVSLAFATISGAILTVPSDRSIDRSRIVVVLALLFVLAGYAVPWIHMERTYPWLGPVPSGPHKIDIFVWGFSACRPIAFFDGSEQFAVLWVQLLQPSPLAARAVSLLRQFSPAGEYLYAGSFVSYLLATIVSLSQLSRRGKKARAVKYTCGLLLASLLLFLTGLAIAVTYSHLTRFSGGVGTYLCAVSLILSAFLLALRIGPVHIDRLTVARALVEMFRSERCQ